MDSRSGFIDLASGSRAPNATWPGLGDDLLAREAAKHAKFANRGITGTRHRATVRTMGTSVWEQGPAWVAENFDSVNPATSEVIGTYPVQGRSEVDAVVERARQAASWWAGLT